MRGRSCRQGSKGERGEINKKLHNKLKEEPHLSGAYIRSLVKQLTSSRIKDPSMNPNEPNTMEGNQNQFPPHPNLETTFSGENSQPQHHKKQVRRRLHTSRPYQERLLNMAEARREIVTALKFHRASMKKQAGEPQQEYSQTNSAPPQEEKIKSRRNSRNRPSNESDSSPNHPLNQSDLSSKNMCYPSFYPSSSSPYSFLPASQIANFPENLNFTLPSQTLGLNLNFQEFSNLDKTFFQTNNNPSVLLSSKPNSMSSPEEISSMIHKSEQGDEGESIGLGLGLHQVMDEEEMAEIRSIGEQHEVEWNDTLNLVTSAWWFKFLKKSEIGGNEKGKGNAYSPFDEEVEFPDWLNADGGCLHQEFLNDHCLDEYLQDPALPCMDIGEIEGMDGEWLS